MTAMVDPVEAFLSGISSTVGRTLLSVLAILAGFGVCLVSKGDWHMEVSTIFGILTFGLLFYWGTFGGWFFIGLFSLIGIFVFMWSFAYDWRPKFSFFGVFTSAVIYYSPLAFSGDRLLYGIGICVGISFCYWVIPYAFYRAIKRNADNPVPQSPP